MFLLEVVVFAGAGDLQAEDVAIDGSGDVFAAGRLLNTTSGQDFAVIKVDGATGAELWRAEVDGYAIGGAYDAATALAVDGGGDVLAVGFLESVGRPSKSRGRTERKASLWTRQRDRSSQRPRAVSRSSGSTPRMGPSGR